MNDSLNVETREPLLESEFFNKNSNKNTRVRLYSHKIVLKDSNDAELDLNLQDMTGSFVEKSYSAFDPGAFLILNAYPKTNNQNKRRKVSIELKFALHKNLEDNFNYVNKWHLTIDELIKKCNEFHGEQSSNKPYLVIINPKSGSGLAPKIFLQNVIKIWTEAKLYNKIVVTESENFAYEYVKTLKLDDYRGIVVVSGDGVVHQVLNGLISRKDWKTAVKTQISQIPAGSANGLSSSIAFLNGENIKDVSLDVFASMMAFRLLKSRPTPIDIIKLQLENGSILHSFLNVEWAIVADVDSESESYRFLGGLRFIIGALLRILNLRIYKGRISFLPANKDYQPKNTSIQIKSNENNYKNISEQKIVEGFSHLTAFDKPVPNDWLTIEDEFVSFLLVNLPLIGQDYIASPDSKFDDGLLYLTFIRKGISKIDLIKVINDSGSGNFLKNPNLEWVCVKAFRLEPLENYGTIMIDGEKIDYGKIQGEILPSFGRALV